MYRNHNEPFWVYGQVVAAPFRLFYPQDFPPKCKISGTLHFSSMCLPYQGVLAPNSAHPSQIVEKASKACHRLR